MNIINLVKSTLITSKRIPKDKYFLDHMQASFHIQSLASKLQFKFEPCIALQDGEDYFHIEKASENVREDVRKLTRNNTYHVYVESVSNNDDRGDYGSATYSHYITTQKPSYSTREQKTIYIDSNGEIYWVGAKILLEKPGKEYEDIQPLIDKALEIAATRHASEHQNRLKLFAQQQEELKRRQAELDRAKAAVKQTQTELDVEAAQLAGDAMKFDV